MATKEDPKVDAKAEEVAADEDAPRADETVPGGRYVKEDGSVQDAHGNVLEEAPAKPVGRKK
jgi:hypothetical protein